MIDPIKTYEITYMLLLIKCSRGPSFERVYMPCDIGNKLRPSIFNDFSLYIMTSYRKNYIIDLLI